MKFLLFPLLLSLIATGCSKDSSEPASKLSSVSVGIVKDVDYDEFTLGIEVTDLDGQPLDSAYTLPERSYPRSTSNVAPRHSFEVGSWIVASMSILKAGQVIASTANCEEPVRPFQVQRDPSLNFVPLKLCRANNPEIDPIITEPDDKSNVTIDPNIDGEGSNSPAPAPAGTVVGSYFVEWGIYGRQYDVSMIPAEKLTHLLYGFIAICGPNQSLQQANPEGYSALMRECANKEDYTVTVHDRFAALEKTYPGDKWDDPIRGNFGQLAKLKAAHPHLTILPSIGGWTLSDPFFYLAKDPTLRARFVASTIDFLKAYPMFDGLDIDWEFPGGEGANPSLGGSEDKAAFAVLMRELREGLNRLSTETGRRYQLTAAVGAGPSKIAAADYKNAAPYMDYIFAMTYDFYGAWNNQLGHHTGLFAADTEIHEDYSAAAAIDNLIRAGVPPAKLVLGFAMYGRGWSGVTAYRDGNPFTGQGGRAIAGTWEAGILDYKDIESRFLGGPNGRGINGFQYYYDEKAEAAYLWNAANGSLISFDDVRSTRRKGIYARAKGLAGLFSWEIDADNGNLLDAALQGLSQ